MAHMAAVWRRAHAAALVVALLPAVLVAVLKALVAEPLPVPGHGERAVRKGPQRRDRSPDRHEPHAGSPADDVKPLAPAEATPSDHQTPHAKLPPVAEVGALAYVVDGVRTYPV